MVHISEAWLIRKSGLVKEDIVSLKCDVLLRIAKFVLEVDQPLTGHPTTLDLSNFKHAETPSADTPLALKAFQVELSDVQSIDLSRNDLLGTCTSFTAEIVSITAEDPGYRMSELALRDLARTNTFSQPHPSRLFR